MARLFQSCATRYFVDRGYDGSGSGHSARASESRLYKLFGEVSAAAPTETDLRRPTSLFGLSAAVATQVRQLFSFLRKSGFRMEKTFTLPNISIRPFCLIFSSTRAGGTSEKKNAELHKNARKSVTIASWRIRCAR